MIDLTVALRAVLAALEDADTDYALVGSVGLGLSTGGGAPFGAHVGDEFFEVVFDG